MIVDFVVDVGLTRFSEMLTLLLLQQLRLLPPVPQRLAKKLKAAILVIFGLTPLGRSVGWRMISSKIARRLTWLAAIAEVALMLKFFCVNKD